MIIQKIKKHVGLVFAAMLTAASFAAPAALGLPNLLNKKLYTGTAPC
jgi:hypothetical protein